MKSRNGSLNYLSFVLEARKRGGEEKGGEGRRGGGGKNVIFVSSSRVCIYVRVLLMHITIPLGR